MKLLLNCALVVSASLLAAGCFRNTHPTPTNLDGVRFTAVATVAGAAHDTLKVELTAMNTSGHARELAFSQCGSGGALRLLRIDARKSVAWDRARWQTLQDADSRSIPGIERVCITSLLVMVLPAGIKESIGSISMPLLSVFGDSLADGIYSVEAKPYVAGYAGKYLDAGRLHLTLPDSAQSAAVNAAARNQALCDGEACPARKQETPLFVVDGVIVPRAVSSSTETLKPYITVEEIALVEPFAPAEAVRRFGEIGSHGIIVLKSKKYVREHPSNERSLGPDDFPSTGRLLSLPGGRRVRILSIAVMVVGDRVPAAKVPVIRNDSIVGKADLIAEPGSTMSVYISTDAARGTDDVRREAADMLATVEKTVTSHDVRRATVIVCRTRACAEMREVATESFEFKRSGNSWIYNPTGER